MTQAAFLSREPVWTDADFNGRSAALAWLAGQLGRETPQNCNIVGEPRIGKTSLLHAAYRRKIGLPARLAGIDVWLRLVELADRGPAAFWTQLLVRLCETARGVGIILPGGAPKPDDPPWQVYRALESTLERLEAETPRPRVVVFIDDFELLIPNITAQDLDWLRALATRFASLFAMVITTTDPLEQVCRSLSAKQVSPLPNIFATYHLGLLTEDETTDLIQAAANAEGRPALNPELVQFLRAEVGRHPDLLKLGCEHLFQVLAEEGDALSPEEIMDAVRSDFRYDAHTSSLCERLYERRTEEERAFLAGVTGGAPAADPILLRRLERKLGLVEVRDGQPTVFADACNYWLARHQGPAASPADTTLAAAPAGPTYQYQPELREVRVGERTRKLSAVEDRLFQYLAGKPNQVCTTQELLVQVWGTGRTVSVVEKTVNRLRDKVEEDPARPRVILSIRGEGYLLRPPDK